MLAFVYRNNKYVLFIKKCICVSVCVCVCVSLMDSQTLVTVVAFEELGAKGGSKT